jgi:hypothetical protein
MYVTRLTYKYTLLRQAQHFLFSIDMLHVSIQIDHDQS